MAEMLMEEQLKTCGTCYWMMMQPGHGECGACGNPEFGIERWPEAYSNGYYLYTTVDGDCEGEFWKPRTETPKQRICHRTCEKCAVPDLTSALQDAAQIGQRYQQLAAVAGKMLLHLQGRYIPFMPCTEGYAIQEFTRMLEECGVDVNG